MHTRRALRAAMWRQSKATRTMKQCLHVSGFRVKFKESGRCDAEKTSRDMNKCSHHTHCATYRYCAIEARQSSQHCVQPFVEYCGD
jgi:hypothetical protein